jgi:hypothetical protein
MLVGLVAAAVMMVLVTPALDEIPCTVGENTRYQAAPASVKMLFLTLISPPAGYQCNTPSQLSRVMDVLSSSCTLVC